MEKRNLKNSKIQDEELFHKFWSVSSFKPFHETHMTGQIAKNISDVLIRRMKNWNGYSNYEALFTHTLRLALIMIIVTINCVTRQSMKQLLINSF